jgi:hypothetical protein
VGGGKGRGEGRGKGEGEEGEATHDQRQFPPLVSVLHRAGQQAYLITSACTTALDNMMQHHFSCRYIDRSKDRTQFAHAHPVFNGQNLVNGFEAIEDSEVRTKCGLVPKP